MLAMKANAIKDRQSEIAPTRASVNSLCKRTGLSQAQVASYLGVRAKTLSAWLSGSVECRHRQMLELAIEALIARLASVPSVKEGK